MIAYTDPQGTEAWLEARRGVITGSRAKDARDRNADKVDKKTGEITRGAPSAKHMLYAMDTARERCGGKAAEVYVNAAMRFGIEQEGFARMAYEAQTGAMVEEAGFVTTDDGLFGCSVDGFVEDDGMVEIKTLVSSDTLFKAMVGRDWSAYIDQINFALWLTGRKWCDLVLWAPDLPEHKMTVIRIERDEDEIELLERDMVAFNRLVGDLEADLRRAMGQPRFEASPAAPPTAPAAPRTSAAAAELPASIFS